MAKRKLPMTVIDLTRSGLVLFLLVFLMFLPAVGSTQESAQSNEDSAAVDSGSTKDATDIPITEFKVSPNRCVTLRQGQPCFVRIRFEWQATEVVKACMYGVDGKQLKCWQASSGGNAYIAQTLPNTTDFVLLNDEGVELSRASVSVAWVYKKKRSKRRWRLF